MINTLPKSLIQAAEKLLLEQLQFQHPEFHQLAKEWVADGNNIHFSDHAFPNPQEMRTYIPLEKSNDDADTPHVDVKNHLEENGYKIKNYREGIATDKYGRDVKIGKALNNTKAPEHIMKAFMHDNQRKSSTHNDLAICISRHPHDVMGMSTDRGWSSCMNLRTGSNSRYLKPAVNNGTHVAYLIRSHDKLIDNPIARITLQPHHSPENMHTILRPEATSYGTGTDDFSHTVRKWSENNFPARHAYYTKNPEIYNDDKRTFVVNTDNKEMLNDLVTSKDEIHRQIAATTGLDHVGHALINDPSALVRKNIAYYGNDSHREKLLNDPDPEVRAYIAANTTNINHLNKAINDFSPYVRATVALRGQPEHLDKLVHDRDANVRSEVVKVGTDKHRDILVHDKNPFVREHVAIFVNLGHIIRLEHDPDRGVQRAVKHRLSKDPYLYNQYVNFKQHYQSAA